MAKDRKRQEDDELSRPSDEDIIGRAEGEDEDEFDDIEDEGDDETENEEELES